MHALSLILTRLGSHHLEISLLSTLSHPISYSNFLLYPQPKNLLN